jgi:hypothetical protein
LCVRLVQASKITAEMPRRVTEPNDGSPQSGEMKCLARVCLSLSAAMFDHNWRASIGVTYGSIYSKTIPSARTSLHS